MIMNIDTVETCKEMVNHNLGYSIIPLSSIKEDDNFEVIKLKSKNGEQILRNTYIIYEDYSLELPLVSKFINFITS
ncbi:MAG TPA: LysR substrate-binding domain-containing protein [Candidatus Avamphibacillus sp.]|nr:LysR substrate-binding domain-containing protein [Candidatus Avamphibacillus sp.]